MWHTHWLKEVPVCMYFFLVWKPVISVACTCTELLLCHEYLHDTIRLHWIEIQMKCTTQKHSLPLFTGRHEPDSDTIALFLSPPVQIARWALMRHCQSVCLSVCLSGCTQGTLWCTRETMFFEKFRGP